MIYNDEQLPNDDSIAKMQQGYARKVSILQTEDTAPTPTPVEPNQELGTIASSIDWETNTALLNALARTPNRCMRSFIRGLIPLNEQDSAEISGYYIQNGIRRNPSVINLNTGTFNQTLRDYIRAEAELLDKLVELLYLETDSDRRTSLRNILRRRLDALDTLASFWSSTLFG